MAAIARSRKAKSPGRKSGPSRQRPRAPVPNAMEAALASLAHEVRTPLTAILAHADLLRASDLPARERAWVSALHGAAEHIAAVTTVVVEGAQAGAGRLRLHEESFSPARLAAALGESLTARALVRGLAVVVAVAPDLPLRVVGDATRLRAAVENLIDNAVKFTPSGRVRLAVAASPGEGTSLMLTFTVQDQGIGLSPAELRRLFRPFARGERAIAGRFGGAGLGLTFARSIARAMHGDLQVESVPGQGSAFRFTARVSEAGAQEAAGSPALQEANPSRRALRLLCAEDNPHARVVLNAIASELGHRLDFVETGETAVAAVADGGYDGVLMDLTLAGVDGIEATRRIRALAGPAGATPVIGISGRGKAEERAARRAGMDAFLRKPVAPAALAAALKAVAAG